MARFGVEHATIGGGEEHRTRVFENSSVCGCGLLLDSPRSRGCTTAGHNKKVGAGAIFWWGGSLSIGEIINPSMSWIKNIVWVPT